MPPVVARVSLLRGVARRDVRDLVSENPGKLGLVVEVRQVPLVSVDEPCRQRERVDRRMIDDREAPRQVRTMGQRRETTSDVRHVTLEFRVVSRISRRMSASACWPIAISWASLMNDTSRLPLTGLVAQPVVTMVRKAMSQGAAVRRGETCEARSVIMIFRGGQARHPVNGLTCAQRTRLQLAYTPRRAKSD